MAVVFIDGAPAAKSPLKATTRRLLPCPLVLRTQIKSELLQLINYYK